MTAFDPRSYWDERHTRRYGPESVGFIGLGVPFNVWMYRVRRHVVEREIRKAGIESSTSDVLDIGSGTGFYIDLWSRLRARSVTGSDFAPYAVASLRERYPDHRFLEIDITSPNLPRDIGLFDAVSAFDIFYHIVDDAKYSQAFRNRRRASAWGLLRFLGELHDCRAAHRRSPGESMLRGDHAAPGRHRLQDRAPRSRVLHHESPDQVTQPAALGDMEPDREGDGKAPSPVSRELAWRRALSGGDLRAAVDVDGPDDRNDDLPTVRIGRITAIRATFSVTGYISGVDSSPVPPL
jgi:SAM-dependent methyltransferase